MNPRIFGFRAASVLVCICSIGLLVLISCGTPGSGGGDNGGGDANADTNPSGSSDNDPVACCFPDGNCEVMPFVDCAVGVDAGAGIGTPVDGVSSCAGDPCNRGACCSGGGCLVTSEAECEDNYQGDATSCESNLCLQGACCLDDAEGLGPCIDETRDSCENDLGGTWKGVDTACEPTKPCGGDADQGACCTTNGSCTVTDEATCILSDRSYAGDGVDCENALCNTGACCGQDRSCTETFRFGCFDDFRGLGTRCANDSCADSSGACCFPNGSCTATFDQMECESLGASFQGQGSSCFGTICQVTEGYCCLQSGECVIVDNAEACDALTGLSGISSTFAGAGTECIGRLGDVACGPPFQGACCFSFGRCEYATQERCGLLDEGVFIGIYIGCSDFARLPADCTTR